MEKAATEIGPLLSSQIDGWAIELADKLKASAPRKTSFRAPKRLKKLKRFFQTTYNHFDEGAKAQSAIPSTADWLLDNFHVLEQTIRVVSHDLSPDYYARLPKTKDGWARIHVVALALTYGSARLDVEQFKHFLKIFQSTTNLKIGELWALPLMLRLAVLETLADGLAEVSQLNWDSALEPELWKGIKSASDSPKPNSETKVINSFFNLRLIGTLDWKEFVEATNVLEPILRKDPAEAYGKSDFETRNRYRGIIEDLALGSSMEEAEIASLAIQLSELGETVRERHVGYYLIVEGRPKLEKITAYRAPVHTLLRRFILRNPLLAYLGSIVLVTVIILLSALFYIVSVGGDLLQISLTMILAIFPALAIAADLINWLMVFIIPPHTLPKIDFEFGMPSEYRTMIVIPALFGTKQDIAYLMRQMERHFVANNDTNIFFALLTDFADADEEKTQQDEELIAQAIIQLQQLNEKYGREDYQPFYLFHRRRQWNASEESWIGWERKRGKLEEFNRLVRGANDTSYTTQIGNLSVLPSVRYVITLDSDTLLPRESARRLIGTLAHPLNRAEFEAASNEVKAGYSILQPRVQVRPVVANQSIFTRIYSGDSVIDLYTRAVSDVYQDLFGEGNFVGKGIYDVDAFQRSLEDKVPENHLLSHDLFEAIHGRCGLVTDIVFYEDYPPHYLAYTDRLHRWVRGDWQLLPWLNKWVPHRTSKKFRSLLSTIDWWRIFDNLRRSLISPVSLLLLITGWLYLPGEITVWTIFALAPSLMPIVVNDLSRIRTGGRDSTAHTVRFAALRSLFEIIFLPHESLIHVDAIATTLSRLYITHKRKLQWTSSAHTVQLFGKRLQIQSAWQVMRPVSLFAIAVAIFMFNLNPAGLLISVPFLIAWLISPYIAASINEPEVQPQTKITAAQENKLRLLARSTWLFFEHFVGPEDRWLPPDHFQENPRGLVQHQTSPTNIGLLLLSSLAAKDMGYLGMPELSVRLRNTFDSMDSLERMRGHFLNWYDTRSLTPLLPRYISTVDSGNLAACLLALKQGCLESQNSPVVQWQGLTDTINMLLFVLESSNIRDTANELKERLYSLRSQAEALDDPAKFSPTALVKLFEEDQTDLEDMFWDATQNSKEETSTSSIHNLFIWIQRTDYLIRHIRTNLRILAPWLTALEEVPRLLDKPNMKVKLASAWNDLLTTLTLHPTLGEIPGICDRACQILETIVGETNTEDEVTSSWCEVLIYDLRSAQKFSASLIDDFSALAQRAETFFDDMNFNFLFDPDRRVFHIGYNVESGRMDSSYYDLLASEARIASLIAIARGDVPQNHWLYLARPLTDLEGKRALLSWSGTMFEYLMPSLFVKNYPNTLLNQSCHVAVEQQIAYGSENNIPWGVSESSYYNFDSAQIYQYQAFGIPHLGYKRGLADNLVVAPYASLLALQFAPRDVMKNLAWFEKHKIWALYGLYESIDFTPERLKFGEEFAIIRSYMAHHQGMILLSVYNYLLRDRMVQRLHADPRIRSIELLLQEQPSLNAPVEQPRPQQLETEYDTTVNVSLDPWRASAHSSYPQVHCLSNGTYGLIITASGAGFSRWDDIELTRWRSDSTIDNWGHWVYVQDRNTDKLWSVTPQPTMSPPDRSETTFRPHHVEFERQDGDIVMRTSIYIAPDDDVEIRRINITNHGKQPRLLALTSYEEIILNQQAVDQRHPAFNKLFVESEYLPQEQCLLFHRRPRSSDEKPIYLAHFFTNNHGDIKLSGYETDRKIFLGRQGTPNFPGVFSGNGDSSGLTGTTGATLDPICALQADVDLPAYETAEIAFVTLAAGSRKEALQLVHAYRAWPQINRAFDAARTQTEEEIILLNITSQDIERYQKLLSPLLFSLPSLRADPAVLASNTLGQSGLWSFGISGDYPILLFRQKNEEDVELLREILKAYTYWRRRGLMIDIVILNQRESGYDEDLQGKIYRSISRSGNNDRINKRGGIFILREDQMNEAEQILLQAVARVILDEETGSLEEQLSKLDKRPTRLPLFVPLEKPSLEPTDHIERPATLLFDNGLGGFTPDGREYVIYLAPGQSTPAPWINVIATPSFGCLVSESGLGCSWAQNSGENRLTPWHNDPVSDTPAEAIYLHDEDTGEVWSPTPLPARADAPYLIRHGTGYSIFQHASHGLEQNLRVFTAPKEPVKIIQLKLQNKTNRLRRVNAVYYAEWVLGTTHSDTAPYIIPDFASDQFALLASNPYNQDFHERVAFLGCTREVSGMTTSRAEFLGNHGSYASPAALNRIGLTPQIEAGIDPCAVLQTLLWLRPGETKEVTFLLGQGKDRSDAERLISHFHDIQNVESAWEETNSFWDQMLTQVQVETPDKAMDLLLNRWLLYQSLSSRFWGRTAFYQSSGAYGYRDQLQDVMAYIHTKPELVREHILETAKHQFEEGDVLHWWHPPAGRGVRTRCSDDLLWLPYVTAAYVEATGDTSILGEMIPFLNAEPLKPTEHERYGEFPNGSYGSIYEHCCRAIARGTTSGVHGIPLMGAHDWNDGMNQVGAEGRGESIWLGWFLSSTLTNFAKICELMNDNERAKKYRNHAQNVNEAIESAAWDDDWYLRAYYDDGFPLGSKSNNDCQIDSLAQSWAVISKGGSPERVAQAMDSVYKRLVNHDDELILLLKPPFDKTPRNPGYIKGYPPGIRENGGQYTHAALWVIWAFADLGQGNRAHELFQMINPIYHTDTREKAGQYQVEPYVVAADVYSAQSHPGRGGWTWYTGSASWTYRLGVERLLGITRSAEHLEINPCIPSDWKEYKIKYRFGGSTYNIRVEKPRGANCEIGQIEIDGTKTSKVKIPLQDDGRVHEVVVTLR